jgi:beta-glucosidase
MKKSVKNAWFVAMTALALAVASPARHLLARAASASITDGGAGATSASTANASATDASRAKATAMTTSAATTATASAWRGPWPGAVDEATAEARAKKILAQMTPEEKIDYIGGEHDMFIRAIPRLGVPQLKMSDGPLGVRTWGPTTSYPAGIAMAASWDPELEQRLGEQMGRDARARGVNFILGPGMNIYRAPMCGRNFEYFGEDPYLASRMAVAVINGIQSEGVSATAKHYMGNNQEWDRHNVSSDIDERTMREIYLPAFEASIKEGHVGAIMDSYNLINGVHATQNPHLMQEIAEGDWGFKGIIMSDWSATYDGVAAANAGLDLEMPRGDFMNRKTLQPAIQDGRVKQATIDQHVLRILRTAIEFGFFDRPQEDPNVSIFNSDGRKVALDAALSGMVLLKNEGVLPLERNNLKNVAVIGPNAFPGLPEGGGSSHPTPVVNSSFLEAVSSYLMDTKAHVMYASGSPDVTALFSSTHFATAASGGEEGLSGEYFDNVKLEGTPKHTETDAHINFREGHGAAPAEAPTQHYSVRWTGYYTPKETADYNIYVDGRDGFRLYIDDKLVMDQWEWESTELQLESMRLEAGKAYKFRLEYFRNNGRLSIGFGIGPSNSPEIAHAKEIAAKADAVILCVGFNETTEGEGRDRTFRLPGGQDALVNAIESANKHVIVVLSAGGNVDMTRWIDGTPALIDTWYPGQEGGTALAKILFGDASPSGKLPASFEKRWEDNPTHNSYYDKNGDKHVAYTEGLFVGYRGYEKTGTKPQFPFGYGLSYTSFKYSNLKVTPSDSDGSDVKVSFDITNTGKREGAEIGEVYVAEDHAKVERPAKELKGFGKVNLMPGETKTVTVALNRRAFSYYDVAKKDWVADPGDFSILVGSSSDKIELTGKARLTR